MSVYKSKFQPIMERWSLVLKIVLLTTGLMFLLRTFRGCKLNCVSKE